MKTIYKSLAPLLLSLAVASPLYAETSEVICATVEVTECVSGQACTETSSVAIDVPPFLRVNFEERMVTGKRANGDDLKAPISFVHRTEAGVLLQGEDDGLGWSMTLSETDGSMSLAVSGDFVGYVIFGNCTPL